MTQLLLISALVALAVGTLAQTSCQQAFDMCIFTFQGASSIPTYSAGSPGSAISPAIIYRAGGLGVFAALSARQIEASPSGGVSADNELTVGSIDATGEAFVLVDGDVIPISEYTCPQQSFSATFFKAASLGTSPSGFPISGVAHQTPQGDQVDCLDDLCVILTIEKWQTFSSDGVMNVVSSAGERLTNCAVFKMSV